MPLAGIADLAAALSFCSRRSRAPLLVLMPWFTASLYPGAQGSLISPVNAMTDPAAAQVAHSVLANARQQASISPLAGRLGLAGLLSGASTMLQVAFAHVPGVLPLITKDVSLLLLPVWVYHACLVLFAAVMIPALIDERAAAPGSGAAMAE